MVRGAGLLLCSTSACPSLDAVASNRLLGSDKIIIVQFRRRRDIISALARCHEIKYIAINQDRRTVVSGHVLSV